MVYSFGVCSLWFYFLFCLCTPLYLENMWNNFTYCFLISILRFSLCIKIWESKWEGWVMEMLGSTLNMCCSCQWNHCKVSIIKTFSKSKTKYKECYVVYIFFFFCLCAKSKTTKKNCLSWIFSWLFLLLFYFYLQFQFWFLSQGACLLL